MNIYIPLTFVTATPQWAVYLGLLATLVLIVVSVGKTLIIWHRLGARWGVTTAVFVTLWLMMIALDASTFQEAITHKRHLALGPALRTSFYAGFQVIMYVALRYFLFRPSVLAKEVRKEVLDASH